MSTIGRRIETAIGHLIDKDYENALLQVCVAIDGTAKRKWPGSKPGKRIRQIVQEYEAFIWQFASSGGIRMLGSNGSRGKISLGSDLPDLVYKSIRCVLHHGDELSDFVIIRDGNNMIGIDTGKPVLNKGFIDGLLFSVVADEMNEREICNPHLTYSLNESTITINDAWGRLQAIEIFTGYKKVLQ